LSAVARSLLQFSASQRAGPLVWDK